jgi:hypothetical protein
MAAMKAKESERVGLEERLRLLNASNVISLHPNVIQDYTAKIEELHQAMTEDPSDPKHRLAFRNMIDSVVVHPTAKGERYDIDVFGRLSAILGIDLFPTKRSNAEILAEQGVIYGDSVKPG